MTKSAEFKRLRKERTGFKLEAAKKRFQNEGLRIVGETGNSIIVYVGLRKVEYFPFTERHTDFGRGSVRGLDNFIALCKKCST